MTHLPGELGHSCHLLVLGNLSPPGGAPVLPRWPRSDPHPEPILLTPHGQGLHPFDLHSVLAAFLLFGVHTLNTRGRQTATQTQTSPRVWALSPFSRSPSHAQVFVLRPLCLEVRLSQVGFSASRRAAGLKDQTPLLGGTNWVFTFKNIYPASPLTVRANVFGPMSWVFSKG